MMVVERSEGRYFVESRSTKEWRHVKRIGEAVFTCDCPWGLLGSGEKDCAHVKAVKSK